jgi:hypothetical protein
MPQIESAFLHSNQEHESSAPAESPSRGDQPKALRYFHANAFWEAARSARALLLGAKTCLGCSRALAHLYDRLGSTLFRDDDPQALIDAFDPEDRNSCTLGILAACIVLNSRERIVPTVH